MIGRVASEIALYSALGASVSVGSGCQSIEREAPAQSAPASSPGEKSGPRVGAAKTEQGRDESGPVIEGLQLLIRLQRAATIPRVVTARLELRNLGKRPRTLATYRVEMLDEAEAGLLQLGTRFATEPELKLCGLRQQATDWKHTAVQVTLRPGEVLKEEWVITGRGVPTAKIDGSLRDGEVCLDQLGKYRIRAVLAVQDMDRSERKRGGSGTYHPYLVLPSNICSLEVAGAARAPN